MNDLSSVAPVPRIAVIIPCLNEGAVIGDHVREILSALRTTSIAEESTDVIVVDNGSTDDTALNAEEAGARVVSEPRRGYGRACLSGVEAATNADILVFMDGDRSDDPRELPIILNPLLDGQADLVVGSRLLGNHEPGSLTAPQRFGSWIGCWALSLLYGIHLNDFGPFRAIRRDDLLALNMQDMTYGWPLEMLARAGKVKLRVASVPVTWRKRAGGESKVSGNLRASVNAAYRYLRTLYKCR